MKKKILYGAIASLFAVATVFNMGLLNFSSHSDATLEAIAVMAQAQSESNEEYTNATGCIAVWENVTCIGKDGRRYSYSRN